MHARGALNALEAAHTASATFVLASTQRIYPLQPGLCREDDSPQPDSPYGYAKWVAELWCRMAAEHYAVPVRVLRFFSVYGPGQQANGGSGVVSIFGRAALAGEPLIVQSAGRRDFTDARDVARGISRAIDDACAHAGHIIHQRGTQGGCQEVDGPVRPALPQDADYGVAAHEVADPHIGHDQDRTGLVRILDHFTIL